jgi:hypothetical protein
MGIWIDAESASELQTALMPSLVQIKSPGIGIYFYSDAVLSAGSQDRINIDVISWST